MWKICNYNDLSHSPATFNTKVQAMQYVANMQGIIVSVDDQKKWIDCRL